MLMWKLQQHYVYIRKRLFIYDFLYLLDYLVWYSLQTEIFKHQPDTFSSSGQEIIMALCFLRIRCWVEWRRQFASLAFITIKYLMTRRCWNKCLVLLSIDMMLSNRRHIRFCCSHWLWFKEKCVLFG